MIEVHLIGYTADLRHVVLDVDPHEERGRYRLVVDGDLFATLDDMRVQRWEQGLDVGAWEPAEAIYLDEDVEDGDVADEWVEDDEDDDGHDDLLASLEDTDGIEVDLPEVAEGTRSPLAPAAPHVATPVGEDWDDVEAFAPDDDEEDDLLGDLSQDATMLMAAVSAAEEIRSFAEPEPEPEPLDDPPPPPPAPSPSPAAPITPVRILAAHEVPAPEPAAAPLFSAEIAAVDEVPYEESVPEEVAFEDVTYEESVAEEAVVEEAPYEAPVAAWRPPPGPVDPGAAPYPPIRVPVGGGREHVSVHAQSVDRQTVDEDEVPTELADEAVSAVLDSDVPSPSALPSSSRGRVRAEALEVPTNAEMTPAEIQAALRAGTSLRVVAQRARTSEAWVQRWLEPIEAERQRIIVQAQGLRVLLAEGESAAPLGRSVTLRLKQRGVDPSKASWDAARRTDGTWRITCKFPEEGRTRSASWLLPRGQSVLKSASELARDVGWVDRRTARSRAK